MGSKTFCYDCKQSKPCKFRQCEYFLCDECDDKRCEELLKKKEEEEKTTRQSARITTRNITSSVNSPKPGNVTKSALNSPKPTNTVKKEGEVPCCKCNASPLRKQMIRCDCCQKQYCTTCISMTKSVYTALHTLENAHWFCNPCNAPAMSLIAAERSMKEACESYMEGISSKLEEFEHNLINKASITTVAELSKTVDELSFKVEELREKPALAPQKDSSEAEMIAVSEIEERTKRSTNLMLFNLKESGESADEIKRDDEAKLKEIARIMDTSFEALKAIRIGKKETGKTRPLKVIFQSREERNGVLSKAKNLRTSNEEMAKNLVIKMDLTPMQRQEEKQLLVERNKWRDEERSQMHTWIIRSGKILRIKKKE